MTRSLEWLATLSPELRAVLDARPTDDTGHLGRDTIPRREWTDTVPLSFAQQRLWFIEQLEPGTHTYNSARAARLRGPLDTAVMRQCLSDIVERHEALRTSFTATDGRPVQVIARTLSFPLPVADLSGFPENEREAQARHLAVEEIRRPFDLTRAPLLRVRLVRLGPEEHILILTMHHIVSDEWSQGVLFRELAILYEAHLAGVPAALPDLPIQYADYAVWQREWLQGQRLERELTYWRERLRGAPPVLELPTDRPRPPVQTFRGAKQSLLLPGGLGHGLRALSRSEGSTLFMTLLAAFQTLLARYTGRDDIVVGSPIAGRTRTETEGLIGFFVNTLALRTDLSGDPTFRELLRRVREVAFGAYEHQDLPFERLVEELQPERSLSHSALLQVMFTLQNAPAPIPRLARLEVEPEPIERGVAKFDLSLFLRDDVEGLRALLEYNTDLFDAGTIARLLGHFRTLLEGIVTDPDRPLSELPLLTEPERYQALVEWNATDAERPREATVHGLFEAQAARTPDAIAATFEGEALSYRELDRRANRLARLLQARGVGPEVPVGLCVERSLDMLVGLLAILKAGGVYLPLDPTYPRERLELMLADAAVPVLVTQRKLLETVPRGTAAAVCLDAEEERRAPESSVPVDGGVTGEQLAYVIYTSGTTGRPKGVQITHSAAVNLLLSLAEVLGLRQQDTVFAVSALTFDMATFELLVPLVVGARVAIAPREVTMDGRLMTAALVRAGATVMHATPATWRMLVESGWTGPLLKAISGGEALPAALAAELLDRCTEVWDLYGPTETTMSSAGAPVRAGVPLWLGNMIANTRLYLLDRSLMPVPIGVPGELYIAGTGLSRGYLGRPGLTADRFLPEPFSQALGARMYRTGDLMRRRPDGGLEFLGRTDHQVKLRGFRIELGEIEAVLAQHPAVRQGVVLAREDRPGDRRLVAYVLPAAGEPPVIGELRDYLRQKLPEYMVPSGFVLLNGFPRTSSGKVDRSALPAPDRQSPEAPSTYVAPRSAVERLLAGICAEVLDVEHMGAHDDFFALGGHSLLATRVIARLETALGVELPVRMLFEAPTIAGLAQRIVAMEQSGELGG
jgi:amino acid adenylation domain-containing protein